MINKKKYTKYPYKEDELQKAVARLLDSYNLVWMHPPNEIKAKPQYLKKRALMGVKSGVPDCIVFTPAGSYLGLAIELKVGYNKPTDNQLKWLEDLKKIGYYTICSNSLDEVIDVVDAYVKCKLL